MNALTLFERLRPVDCTLDPETSERIWQQVTDVRSPSALPAMSESIGTDSGDLTEVRTGGDIRRSARHRSGLIGAAAGVVIGAAGLVAVYRSPSTPHSTTPAGASAAVTEPTAVSDPSGPESTTATAIDPTLPDHGPLFVGVTEPPLLTMSSAAWTLTYINDTTPRHDLFVAVDSVTGFDGASFVILPDYQGVTGEDPRSIPGVEDLASAGIDGTITGTDGFRQIDWKIGDRNLSALTRNVSDADALSMVRSLSFSTAGTVEVATVPDHMVALKPEEFTNLDRQVSYSWSSVDGQQIETTLLGGTSIGGAVPGQSIFQSTQMSDRTVYLSGPFGVTWLDGFWQWGVIGRGFTTLDEFLAAAATVVVTDRNTWDEQVTDVAVTAAQRPAQVAEILSDVALPADFDVNAIGGEDVAQVRYQLIARVISAVWCEWGRRWDAALTTGDFESAAKAASALVSSEEWHALIEINPEGGFPQVVWGLSQRMSDGDRSVWGEAQQTLGCPGMG
jgi:hypothetical protein